MTPPNPDLLIEELQTLLMQQSAALHARDYAGLERLGTRVEALAERLENAEVAPGGDALQCLRRQAGEVADTIGAALDGVRDAEARVRALLSPESEFNTYTRTGDRRVVGRAPRGGLERRA